MQRRDFIILIKILKEIDIAFEMLGKADINTFFSR